jgi:hypothetical protein
MYENTPLKFIGVGSVSAPVNATCFTSAQGV